MFNVTKNAVNTDFTCDKKLPDRPMPFQAILGSVYISAKVLFIIQFPILKLLIQHNHPLKVEVILGSLHIFIIVVTNKF
jgi:hypothetical protein